MSIRGRRVVTLATLHIFYYLNFLLDKNPTQIIDIGCGENLFKKWLAPIEVIGMDVDQIKRGWPEQYPFFADIEMFFDEQWVADNQNKYESVFAISSLHYIDIRLVSKRIKEFVSILKSGGRGLITFNTQRLLEHTDLEFDTIELLEQYIFDQIDTAKDPTFEYIVIDVDVSSPNIPDGDIKLVIDKL